MADRSEFPFGKKSVIVGRPLHQDGACLIIGSKMENERIILRPWTDSDAPALFKYASDPDVGPRAGWPPHKSVEESLEVIRTVFNDATSTWAIVLKATGEPIGAMGYGPSCNCNLPAREGEPLIGYWVARPYWNQGICTEALGLMLAHIRKTTGIRSLISGHFIDNPASGRVMEKCGFAPTGETVVDLAQGRDTPIRVLRLSYAIRNERPEEYREVENLVRESFWNVYRPGCLEHYVLHCLRDDPAFIPELDFVMEEGGRLIGQCIYMHASIKADDGRIIPIVTMGPIGIHPDFKRRGYGKALLDYSLSKAAGMGFGAVCFEGNIDFYGKSGFTYASNFGIRYHGLPEGADASFFLCRELIPGYLNGITGEYATPQGYFVDEQECEAFDKAFPPKVKLKLPGQLW